MFCFRAGGDLLGKTISPFCIDIREVSRTAYHECVIDGPCVSAPLDLLSEGEKTSLKPVTRATWREAANYCAWRGERDRIPGMQLPSEVQWEFAGRGNDGRTFPWGNEAKDGSPAMGTGVVDVNEQEAVQDRTPEGILHLYGNVSEWTRNLYQDPPTDNDDPNNLNPRVVRGGSWLVTSLMPGYLSHRESEDADERYNYIGFRCSLSSS